MSIKGEETMIENVQTDSLLKLPPECCSFMFKMRLLESRIEFLCYSHKVLGNHMTSMRDMPQLSIRVSECRRASETRLGSMW